MLVCLRVKIYGNNNRRIKQRFETLPEGLRWAMNTRSDDKIREIGKNESFNCGIKWHNLH